MNENPTHRAVRRLIGLTPSGLADAIIRLHPAPESITQIVKVHDPQSRSRLTELCIHTRSDAISRPYGLPEMLRRTGHGLKESFPQIADFHVGHVREHALIDGGEITHLPEHYRLTLTFAGPEKTKA